MPDVMISYARSDARAFAERLAEALRPQRSVWLDTSALEGGAEWLQAIQEAIATCGVFLAIRSPAGSTSFWVRSERLFALNRRKPIVPVLAAECPEDDLELISYQPVDFRGDFDAALVRLLHRLDQHRVGIPSADRRTLEQAYLGRILLEHSVWQDLYTPMAGVATLQTQTSSRPHVLTLPAAIDPLFREYLRKQLDQKSSRTATEQRDYSDILEAVQGMRQLVVLGDPGSGKTTTLWRIAVDCATRARSDPTAPLPVFARLGELHPTQTVEQHLLAQLGDLAPFYPDLWREKRIALLLDGLNELPVAARMQHAVQVRSLVKRCQDTNLLVALTCRELDYVGDLDMNIPRRVVITPLDPTRIRQFVHAYIKEPPGAATSLFWQLAGSLAVYKWEAMQYYGVTFEDFWSATLPPVKPERGEDRYRFNEKWREWVEIRDLQSSLLGLAQNPYMLFMLTQVFTLHGQLPANRGELFGWFVDYLLLQRERLSADEAEQLKERLAEMAYTLQSRGGGTGVYRSEALELMKDEHSLYLAQSANLLAGTDELRFTHQLLQEFFAASKLDRMMRGGVPATHFWPTDNWWKPRGWEETAILLAGMYSNDLTPVLHWLRDANPRAAAGCILRSGAHTPPVEREALRSRWMPRLSDETLTPRPDGRAAIGRALGMLDLDDRPGVGRRGDGLPDIAWCEVPAGPFRMGGDRDVEGIASDETVVDIPYPFWIAKYAVTYAQFAAFVEDDGYGDRRWWTEAGWQWKGLRWVPSSFGDARWHLSNHPVVGVTWYEAYAFTRWLDAKVRTVPDLLPEPLRSLVDGNPSQSLIRLPLEAEREKAVRYPDGRKFAWGDDGDDAPANIQDMDPFRLGRTSPVGIYRAGVAPCGAFDLCGNVFDWCLPVYRENYRWPEDADAEGEVKRVAKGGSWLRSLNAARAAYREPVSPETLYDDQGFRLVASVAI